VAETVTATTSVVVTAEPAAVWAGITDPNLISKVFFGARVETDWREGSPITFTGEWDGQPFVDRGVILRLVPERLFRYSYWSPLGGTRDDPANYATITFEVTPVKGGTELVVSQDGVTDDAARAQTESNWKQVLDNLKRLIEEE
jgi:uncharacterized protein YndB with AHSA1/START domain